MTKRVALLHTVPSVYASFGPELKKEIPDVEIFNTVDEFLAADTNKRGELNKNNLSRFFQIIKAMEEESPDAIVVTCSTIAPWVKDFRAFVNCSLIAIDDGMIRKAVRIGKKIMVLATAPGTIKPTISKVMDSARDAGIEGVEVSSVFVPEAYTALNAGNREEHDRLLKERAEKIKGYDVIILAQASMAHLEKEIEKITGCQTLSSPRLCIQQVKETLNAE